MEVIIAVDELQSVEYSLVFAVNDTYMVTFLELFQV